MTTATSSEPSAQTPRQWTRRRRSLGEHVHRTVSSLQAQVLRDPPRPEAVSALARLRRVVGRTPGSDYTLEAYLAVPEELLGCGPADVSEATDAEYAAHDAVTLYALHQQSRRAPMHASGQGLGTAMAALVRAVTGPDGVRRRFAALGTASTYDEGTYHLRSLITMLREHQIPLDYGLLTDDLEALRRPDRRTAIQAIWGREFFHSRPADADDTSTVDTEAPTADSPEEHSA
jgi:CRISPR system Cascade subunit CasB